MQHNIGAYLLSRRIHSRGRTLVDGVAAARRETRLSGCRLPALTKGLANLPRERHLAYLGPRGILSGSRTGGEGFVMSGFLITIKPVLLYGIAFSYSASGSKVWLYYYSLSSVVLCGIAALFMILCACGLEWLRRNDDSLALTPPRRDMELH